MYELTGPRSQDMDGVAGEFSEGLGRRITYADVPPEGGRQGPRGRGAGAPDWAPVTMGELHRSGRYDRLADGVERVTGRPGISIREFVSLHADEFGGPRS